MAPANVARASTSTDSIKGLAQSIAKPAYRRLLVAEPALRRAVPLLIITFLVTMAVGTGVQVLDHRRQTLAIDRNWLAVCKPDLDVLTLCLCLLRRNRHLKNILGRLSPGVFEDPAFVRHVHQVAIG